MQFTSQLKPQDIHLNLNLSFSVDYVILNFMVHYFKITNFLVVFINCDITKDAPLWAIMALKPINRSAENRRTWRNKVKLSMAGSGIFREGCANFSYCVVIQAGHGF